MSLDVYLTAPEAVPCPHCGGEVRAPGGGRELFTGNVTHNLGRMAAEAGVYDCLWKPGEHGIAKAAQLVAPLRAGLEVLRASPGRFVPLNPPNGWGSYEGLVEFMAHYLAACEAHPGADVQAWR